MPTRSAKRGIDAQGADDGGDGVARTAEEAAKTDAKSYLPFIWRARAGPHDLAIWRLAAGPRSSDLDQ
jgi:hypothetical protein